MDGTRLNFGVSKVLWSSPDPSRGRKLSHFSVSTHKREGRWCHQVSQPPGMINMPRGAVEPGGQSEEGGIID